MLDDLYIEDIIIKLKSARGMDTTRVLLTARKLDQTKDVAEDIRVTCKYCVYILYVYIVTTNDELDQIQMYRDGVYPFFIWPWHHDHITVYVRWLMCRYSSV